MSSYMIKAVLSNPQHPEYGQVTLPFPIPKEEYDHSMELLKAMEFGDALKRDCQVDEVDSYYGVLKRLEGQSVNVDELDYLAKRLESFCAGEDAQFQGMAAKLDISDITDFINLTFCCQQATVITDFSDLKKVGQDHYMNLHGGCASTEELENLDGYETALLLIDSGAGQVTPYGVVYDNGMKLEPLYDGRHFPGYLYEPPVLALEAASIHDKLGQVLTVTDPEGGVTSAEYDGNGNITEIVQADGHSVTYAYDKANRLTSYVDADGYTHKFEYDGNGNIITTTDGNGNVTRYTYDGLDRLVGKKDAEGGVSSKTYDADGRLTQVVNEEGAVTKYVYDDCSRVISMTDAEGYETAYTYDEMDRVLTVTDPRKGVITYTYTGRGDVASATDQEGYVTSYEYDANRNMVKMTTPDGDTTYTYDPLDRLTATTTPDGKTETIEYNGEGQVVSTTDKGGHTTRHILDGNGRIVETIDAMGTSTLFEYDAMGRLTKTSLHRVDGQDNVDSWEVTRYQYSGRGLTTKMTDALGNVTTYTYDGDENLVSKTDADNYTTQYTYNGLDMVTHINYNGGKQVDYAYNAVGDLARMEDWTGVNTFEYDLLSQLKKVTDHKGNVVKYDYDGNGNQTAVTYPDDSEVTYEYDGVNNLTSVTESDGRTTTYEYDGMRRVVRMDYPHGWVEEYEYDSIGQLLNVTDSDPSGKDMKQQKHVYRYDDCGNMVYEYMRGNGTGEATVENDYTYDALHRIVRAEEHYGHEVREYTYDSLGSLTCEESNTNYYVDYILNDLNQVTQSSTDNWKTQTAYTYDGRGNLTEKVYGKNKKVTTVAEYVFDETNKMVLGYNALRESSEYTYNGLGALVTNTWVIAKNGYGYHDVDALVNGEELLDPDELLNTPALEPETPGVTEEPTPEPETPDVADEPTAEPETPVADEEPTPEPEIPDAAGEPTPEPETPDAAGEPTPEPETPDVADEPTAEPETPDAAGEPTPESETPGVTEEPTPEPETPDVAGEPTAEPETPSVNNEGKGNNNGNNGNGHGNGNHGNNGNGKQPDPNPVDPAPVDPDPAEPDVPDTPDPGNNGNGNSAGNNGQGNGNSAGNGDGNGSINKTSTVIKDFVVDYNTETFEPLTEHEVNGLDYKYVYGNDRLSVDISPIDNSMKLVENGDHVRLYYHMDYLGTADYLTSPVSGKVEAWTHYNEWGLIVHNAVLKCGQRELDLVKRYATHDYDSVLELYYAKARFYDAHDRHFTGVDPILDPSQYDLREYVSNPVQLVQYLYVANDPILWIDLLGLRLSPSGLSSASRRFGSFVAGSSDFQQVTKDIVCADLNSENYALHHIAQAITGMYITLHNPKANIFFEQRVGDAAHYGFADIAVQLPSDFTPSMKNYFFEVKPNSKYLAGRAQLDHYYKLLKCTGTPHEEDHSKILKKGIFFEGTIIQTDKYDVKFTLNHHGDGVITYRADVRLKPGKRGRETKDIRSTGFVNMLSSSGVLSNQKQMYENKLMKSVDSLTAKLYGKPLSKMTQQEAFEAGFISGIAVGSAAIASISLGGAVIEGASTALAGNIESIIALPATKAGIIIEITPIVEKAAEWIDKVA